MGLVRQYLDTRPRTPDISLQQTYPLSLGREIVYVTENESNSYKRRGRIAGLLIGLIIVSILFNS